MTIRLKTEEEIKTLKEGGERHAQILSELASMVKPGVSTLILEEEARRLIKQNGDIAAHLGYKPNFAQRVFPAALCLSINDEIVHGIPNEKERIINDGDIVSIDLSIKHNGLITDSCITVPCGAIDDESRKLLEITKQALSNGIREAKPGNTTGDIGKAIFDTVKKSGFSIADNLAGHGVGYELHEDPYVFNFGERGKGDKLVPGMVIAIEPMVNVGTRKTKIMKDGYTIKTADGSRSAHFEHTVAITKEGNIVLTS